MSSDTYTISDSVQSNQLSITPFSSNTTQVSGSTENTLTDSVELSQVSATPVSSYRTQMSGSTGNDQNSQNRQTLGFPPPPYIASGGDNPNETPPPYEKRDNYICSAFDKFKSVVLSASFCTLLGIFVLSGSVVAGIVALIVLTGRNQS